MRTWAGHALEIGKGVEGQVYLAGGAAKLVTPDFVKEFAGQIAVLDEVDERQPRVHAGGDHAGVDLIAVFQRDPNGPAILYDDPGDAGLLADLRAGFDCS